MAKKRPIKIQGDIHRPAGYMVEQSLGGMGTGPTPYEANMADLLVDYTSKAEGYKDQATQWRYLILSEGYREFQYLDTAKIPQATIGLGININEHRQHMNKTKTNPLDALETAAPLMQDSRDMVHAEFGDKIFDLHPDARAAIYNLHYSVGHNKFMGFVNFVKAIRTNDAEGMAREYIDSTLSGHKKELIGGDLFKAAGININPADLDHKNKAESQAWLKANPRQTPIPVDSAEAYRKRKFSWDMR